MIDSSGSKKKAGQSEIRNLLLDPCDPFSIFIFYLINLNLLTSDSRPEHHQNSGKFPKSSQESELDSFLMYSAPPKTTILRSGPISQVLFKPTVMVLNETPLCRPSMTSYLLAILPSNTPHSLIKCLTTRSTCVWLELYLTLDIPKHGIRNPTAQLIFHKSMPKMFPRNPVLTLVNGGERVLMTLTPCAGICCYPDKSRWPV